MAESGPQKASEPDPGRRVAPPGDRGLQQLGRRRPAATRLRARATRPGRIPHRRWGGGRQARGAAARGDGRPNHKIVATTGPATPRARRLLGPRRSPAHSSRAPSPAARRARHLAGPPAVARARADAAHGETIASTAPRVHLPPSLIAKRPSVAGRPRIAGVRLLRAWATFSPCRARPALAGALASAAHKVRAPTRTTRPTGRRRRVRGHPKARAAQRAVALGTPRRRRRGAGVPDAAGPASHRDLRRCHDGVRFAF